MSNINHTSAFSSYELTRVALGEIPADFAIVNGKLVNVYTAEIIEDATVLIKGDKIAYAGKYPAKGIGPQTGIIDAGGKTLIPGLIDGHSHVDYLYSIYELVKFALKTGTTTIISEVAQLSSGLGYRGIKEFLKSTRHQPMKFWITIPPMGSISPIYRNHLPALNKIKRWLQRKEVVGLGEVYWGPVISGDPSGLSFMAVTRAAGKKIEGHSAGASGNKLQAYAALGITSDHEPISGDEALERLRLGMTVMIREGEVRSDLEAVSSIKDRKIDFRRLSLSTDGIGPCELINRGFMDYLVQKAIRLGISPVQAIQMATLNVAEHFNLDDCIGGIAPGRFADIVIIPDPENIKPEMVISNGQIVAQNGSLTVQPRRHQYPSYTWNSLHLDREIKPEDFDIPAGTAQTMVKVRVIDQVTHLLTREAILEIPVKNGLLQMPASRDIIKVSAIERLYPPNRIFTGLIRGLGLMRGAIATSTTWDSSDIVVVGASESDMALAVNRLKEINGGVTVCLNNTVIDELAFPIGGILSLAPMEILAEKLDRIQKKSLDLGCTSPDIRTTISILTTGAIPYLRICESGLFNLRINSPVGLLVNEE